MEQIVPEDVLPLIPRIRMPQIKTHDYAALLVFLGSKGIKFSAGYIDPALLKMHQEVDVDMAMQLPDSKLVKPILLAGDNFVLDGDHRGYRHAVDKTQAPFIRIEIDFNDAITALFEFPGTYELQVGEN